MRTTLTKHCRRIVLRELPSCQAPLPAESDYDTCDTSRQCQKWRNPHLDLRKTPFAWYTWGRQPSGFWDYPSIRALYRIAIPYF